ncbi:MAG: DUF58 domain-containing protein [Treponemataceae bacterium]
MISNKLDYQSLIQKASRLRLSSLSLAEGMKNGIFRSLYRGQGIEFAGVRDYLYGDDVRTIDWNVTARINKPYVKMYDEERELIVYVIVDRSLSMQTGFSSKSPLQLASEVAALLIFAAQNNYSPVGAVFFDNEITFSCKPKATESHVMMLMKALDSLPTKVEKGSALSQALLGARKHLKNRSLVIILSDFRTTAYETELAQLASHHDVLAIRLTDNDLPFAGNISFFDPETNDEAFLPTNSNDLHQQWKKHHAQHVERWENLCKKYKVRPLVMTMQDEPVSVLSDFFYARKLS